jgi:hypothetical protein
MVMQGQSQVALSGLFAAGHSSNLGGYTSWSFLSSYRYDRVMADGGLALLPSKNREPLWQGIYLQGGYALRMKKRPLPIQAKYLWNKVSTEIHEMNLAITADYSLDHWYFLLGNNYRWYGFKKSYRESNGFSREDAIIKEPWNLLYTISFRVFPPGHNWNIAGSITNTDFFIMAQETNPMFNLKGTFSPKPGVDLFLESWYKSAGLFNIQVDYYGFFFRFGFLWNIPV